LGKAVCQALILVNGGAITALLAYAGSPHSTFNLDPEAAKTGIRFFSSGLVVAVLVGIIILLKAQIESTRWELRYRGRLDWDKTADEHRNPSGHRNPLDMPDMLKWCALGGFVLSILYFSWAAQTVARGFSVPKPAETVEQAAFPASPRPTPVEQAAPTVSPRPTPVERPAPTAAPRPTRAERPVPTASPRPTPARASGGG
jgi:hypothetical protein